MDTWVSDVYRAVLLKHSKPLIIEHTFCEYKKYDNKVIARVSVTIAEFLPQKCARELDVKIYRLHAANLFLSSLIITLSAAKDLLDEYCSIRELGTDKTNIYA